MLIRELEIVCVYTLYVCTYSRTDIAYYIADAQLYEI